MKKLAISLLFTLSVLFGCNKPNQKIVIDPDISFSIPQGNGLVIKDSVYLKTWEASFEDDRITVFKFLYSQEDTLTNYTLNQHFKKNVDEFLKTFDLTDIDSTYTFQEENVQSDLTFDYTSNGEKYKFFGKLVATRQSFIAFCFHTPFPIDNYSRNLKDKIFSSIEIR